MYFHPTLCLQNGRLLLSDQSLHHPLCIQGQCPVDKLREGVLCAPHVHAILIYSTSSV